MKQIMTITRKTPEVFDADVNTALAEGWEIVKRYRTHDFYYVAELEREEITEAERCCENCKYYEQQPESPPCINCSDDADKWEAAEV